MKSKISLALFALLLTASISNVHASSGEDTRKLKERVATMSDDQKKARLEEITVRVNEIKEMDKSTMSRSERKALKKELREMNKESKVVSGGVYLSVGAIIIIILLLILIL